MEIFIYIIIFIIGTFLGSFCTLAVHRIPLKQNITYERSYCPNCKHKLGLLDLFPVFSYIFLKGKCRYCHKKIRPRYFIIEIFSGILLVLFAISLKMSFTVLEIDKIVYFICGTLYFITLVLIAGIDREYISIQKSVISWGIIFCTIYMLYLYVLQQCSLYKYGICLFLIIILIIISIAVLKKNKKTNYTVEVLLLFMYMALFSNIECMVYTTALTLLTIGVTLLKQKKKAQIKTPIGFYLCLSNICIIMVQNFLVYQIR